jgi:hypothetical protein
MLKVNQVLDTLIVLLLILLSGSILIISLFDEVYLLSILLLTISAFINSSFKKKEIYLFCIILTVAFVCLFCNYFFTISNTIQDYIFLFLRFFYAALTSLVLKSRMDNFIPTLKKVLKFLCVISLLGLIIYIIFPSLRTPVFFAANGYRSTTVGFFYYCHAFMKIGDIILPRNQGIFWEPGVLAIYANILLFLSLFYFKKRKLIIFATIIIITTFSTSGFFIMAVQWLIFIIKIKIKFYYKLFIFIGILIPIAYAAYLSFDEKQEQAENMKTSSYSLRLFDINSAIQITQKFPITGIGIGNEAFLIERDKLSITESLDKRVLENRGNSNSLFSLFFVWGIPFALIIIFCIYKQNIFIHESLLFFILVCLSIMTEPLFYTPFCLFLVYSGIRNILNKL